MATLKDVVGYLCKEYPRKSDLSKARLTKMVYLADWKSCLEYDKQISDIQWIFNYYGPYVDDIEDLANKDPDFNIDRTYTAYGEKKNLISLKNDFPFTSLSKEDINILDNIIEITKKLSWDEFIRLVYSTHPVIDSSRLAPLNLKELAKSYKQNPPSKA